MTDILYAMCHYYRITIHRKEEQPNYQRTNVVALTEMSCAIRNFYCIAVTFCVLHVPLQSQGNSSHDKKEQQKYHASADQNLREKK